MPRSLADGHTKLAVLTGKPVDPARPTVAELNAGIGGPAGVGRMILAADWAFGPTDSATFGERAVAEALEVNAYGVSNFEFGMTVFRYFDENGKPDPVADVLFAAARRKGTTLWVYDRTTGQDQADAWAALDELRMAGEVLTDTPRSPGAGGYIKARVPGLVQAGYPYTAVKSA